MDVTCCSVVAGGSDHHAGVRVPDRVRRMGVRVLRDRSRGTGVEHRLVLCCVRLPCTTSSHLPGRAALHRRRYRRSHQPRQGNVQLLRVKKMWFVGDLSTVIFSGKGVRSWSCMVNWKGAEVGKHNRHYAFMCALSVTVREEQSWRYSRAGCCGECMK